MALSRDGNLLLTSETSGTVSVWVFLRLSLAYQLSSECGFLQDLHFSPDSQRFYTTRHATCYVWGPDTLVRPEDFDLEDRSSLGDVSMATDPVFSHNSSGQVPITALDIDSDGASSAMDGMMVPSLYTRVPMARRFAKHSAMRQVALWFCGSGLYADVTWSQPTNLAE